jgi:hypothetical protein
MPVNYTVQAEVVDIRSDTPKKEDIFLVDTNVWYWYTYTNGSISSLPYQIILPTLLQLFLLTRCFYTAVFL